MTQNNNDSTANSSQDTVEDSGQEFMAGLQGMLDKLVPSETIHVETTTGPVELPVTLPARRQIASFRLLRTLFDMDEVKEAFSGLSDNKPSSVVESIVGLATNERVAVCLGDIFMAAYPDALPDGVDPLDVISLEDLVRSILPFSARFAKRLSEGAGLMIAAQR